MCGESNTQTYITVCKIDSQRESAVWLRKLRGGGGGGRELHKEGDILYLWLIHVEV